MSTETPGALSDLIWAALPLKDVLKGEQRAALVAALTCATGALSGRSVEPHDGAPMHPRKAAEEMHRQCLLACLALGVPPRNLVPQFHHTIECGAPNEKTAPYTLAKLGKSVSATANAMLEAEGNDQ